MPDDEKPVHARKPPLQFRLRTLLVVTAALALLFATLEWLGVPPLASLIVLVVLTFSVLAALGLVVAIAGSITGEEDEEP
jgi:Flp pilus assembly protein TadB